MARGRSIGFLASAAVIPLTALAVGCGGGGDGGGSATASTPPKTANAAVVKVAKTKLGKVLVNSQGRTLYLFTKDSGTTSSCTGMCATFWPPLKAGGKPTAGNGVNASLLGSTSGGAALVTYNGHPLYTFAKDTKPRDVNGEGVTAFGGKWFAVSPAGKRVSPPAPKAAPAPAPAPKASPPQAPAPAPAPAPKASPPPAPAPPPQASPPPPPNNGIPQNGGGDGDADNNGGPDDGDGGV